MKNLLILVFVFLFAIVATSNAAQKKYSLKSIFLKNLNHNQSYKSKSLYKSGSSHQWLRIATYNMSPDNIDTFSIQKYTYYPDGKLKQTKYSEKNFVVDSFIDNSLTSYTYDGAGNISVTLVQMYDSISHNLINSTKDSSFYDSHNNMTYSASFIWLSGAWKLSGVSKTIYTYDSKGKTTKIIYQNADTTGPILNNYRDDLFWNASGVALDSVIEYMPDSIDNNKWIVQDRGINIILLNGDFSKVLAATIQADSGGVWKNIERITTTYNTSGRPLLSLIENYSNGIWVPLDKQVYKYNSHNEVTLTELDTYSDSLKAFEILFASADSLQYDANGNLIIDQQYFFFSGDTAWQQSSKLVHQYQDFSAIKNEFANNFNVSVYPNPCSDHLIIINKNPDADLKISLYDISGKLVFAMQKKGEENISIPTVTLPNGIYNLVIVNGNQVSSSRIVKE